MNFKITFTLNKFPEVIRWTRSGSDEYSQWSNSQDIHKIEISTYIGTSQWHHRIYLLFRAKCPRHDLTRPVTGWTSFFPLKRFLGFDMDLSSFYDSQAVIFQQSSKRYLWGCCCLCHGVCWRHDVCTYRNRPGDDNTMFAGFRNVRISFLFCFFVEVGIALLGVALRLVARFLLGLGLGFIGLFLLFVLLGLGLLGMSPFHSAVLKPHFDLKIRKLFNKWLQRDFKTKYQTQL